MSHIHMCDLCSTCKAVCSKVDAIFCEVKRSKYATDHYLPRRNSRGKYVYSHVPDDHYLPRQGITTVYYDAWRDR